MAVPSPRKLVLALNARWANGEDMKFSTGLRAAMAGTSGAKEQLDLGFIKVFSGAIPETADALQTGTVLWTISVDGGVTGLTWEVAVSGVNVILQKPSADVWQGETTAGTGAYFRVVGSADDGEASTTQPRIQGTVGTNATHDMIMSNVTFTTDEAVDARVLGAASFALPTL